MTQTVLEARPRGVLEELDDVRSAAEALAAGAAVVHGFGNIYAITARGDAATVQAVNVLKGRPRGQVGSLTSPSYRALDAFDLAPLPTRLRAVLREMVDILVTLGPIGLRGPAAAHVPAHLTCGGALAQAQVIVPGRTCPSESFLAAAAAAVAPGPLFVTSANRSHHLTGAPEEPAHWRAEPLRAELEAVPGLVFLEHRDDDAARARFPEHRPTSTTVLSLPAGPTWDGDAVVTLERHGSLDRARVEEVVAAHGLRLAVAPGGTTPLAARTYD